jgi:acyl-CoA synthetase (AMP-forming)/AMP-acid ligase II
MIEESDVDGFFDALSQYELTWFSAAFTVHREILRRAPERPEQVARAKLRFLRMGSGQLHPDEIKRIEQAFRAPMLVALTAAETLAVTHDPLPPKCRKPGSVGLPMENEVAIMDSSGSLCAAGEPGEIVVRGPLVFDGYLNDPELTARSFTGGWFHSGDLGRCDEDGFFYHLGRSKEVINRGGEKIAPVEVDSVIESLPGVRAAACFGVRHPSLGEELVAAVVREPDSTIEEVEIIEHAAAHLSRTHVPRRVYFVSELPRTDTGKVRRSELARALGLDQTDKVSTAGMQTSEPDTVVSPLEAALGGLWASVLQIRTVRPHDDFFLLGGDSLRGARLLASVKAVFGVDVPIQSLFQGAATVVGMARFIEAARSSDFGAEGKSRLRGPA